MFQLPETLQQLLSVGRWPRTESEAIRQNLKPLVPVARINLLAPEENSLYLVNPPFQTVAKSAAGNKFWVHQMAAPSEVDFELALEIGDFGMGSDALILLDYRISQAEPRVLRLLLADRGSANHWVEAAPNLEEFARILGL